MKINEKIRLIKTLRNAFKEEYGEFNATAHSLISCKYIADVLEQSGNLRITDWVKALNEGRVKTLSEKYDEAHALVRSFQDGYISFEQFQDQVRSI